MKVPSKFMLAIDSMNSNISANLLRWLFRSGREHYFISPVIFPESSSSTPTRKITQEFGFFFCRYHLDWISLWHSVLTKLSVLRLALASMRSGQHETDHPRNLYRVGRSARRASSSPAQATGWRHDGWQARPARRHDSRPRSVPTRWNQARGSVGGSSSLFEVRTVSYRSKKYLTSLPEAETICPCVSENAREGGCRPSSY